MIVRNCRRSRQGFTLTELIITMTIILILATIAVAILPRLKHQERSARGADLLQRWLLIARQRALSERAPVGLRLVLDPNDPNIVRELHYIGQPEDFSRGRFTGGPNPSNFSFAAGEADFLEGGTFTAGDPDAPVQPGDYLEVYGGGPVTQITAVAATTLTTTTPTPTLGGGLSTSNYRVIRQPRRLRGENPLLLPQDIGIDLSLSRYIPLRTVGGTNYLEILFAPSGGVIGKGTNSDKIIFYVRDVTQDDVQYGTPSLIVVYVRTGLIAAHPVDIGGADPYIFAKDPRSSGM